MKVKLLTFDLDNTLWETDSVIVKAEQATVDWIDEHVPAAAHHYNLETLREIKKHLAENRPDIRHKLTTLRTEMLHQVFLRSGLDESEAREKADQAFAAFLKVRNQVELFDGAREALEELTKSYQLIALSNGNSDLRAIGLDHLFSHHFNADQVAKPKPHPDMFEAALAAAEVSAHETIHIGDHQQQDVLAAHQLGMKTIWANMNEQTWQEAGCQPGMIITQLSQLPTAIQSLSESEA